MNSMIDCETRLNSIPEVCAKNHVFEHVHYCLWKNTTCYTIPPSSVKQIVVYYESRKRELKRRLINEGRCDERLKDKVEESTCLTYTGLHDKTN
jgi:hypothetical protein